MQRQIGQYLGYIVGSDRVPAIIVLPDEYGRILHAEQYGGHGIAREYKEYDEEHAGDVADDLVRIIADLPVDHAQEQANDSVHDYTHLHGNLERIWSDINIMIYREICVKLLTVSLDMARKCLCISMRS